MSDEIPFSAGFPEPEQSIIAYEGAFTSPRMNRIWDTIKAKLPSKNQILIRRMQVVFTELSQNVCLYSAERTSKKKPSYGVGRLHYGLTNNEHHIVVSNRLFSGQKTVLQSKYHQMKNLDRQGLRSLKMDLWEQPRFDGFEGGNIGLVEVMLKAHNPVDFTFTSFQDKLYISVSVKVSAV